MPRMNEDSDAVKKARALLDQQKGNDKAKHRGSESFFEPVTVEEAMESVEALLDEINERNQADFDYACEVSERD